MRAALVDVLVESFMSCMSYDELIDEDHKTPTWLEVATQSENPDDAEGGTEMIDAPNSSVGKRLTAVPEQGWNKYAS